MRYVVLIALLLAGCAQTPIEVMQTGTSTTRRLKSEPQTAAFCVERNTENFRPSLIYATFLARARPLPPGWEVLVQIASQDTHTIAVVQISPRDSGSEARVWMTERAIVHGRDTLRDAMLAGC